jgi:hypothetical protein
VSDVVTPAEATVNYLGGAGGDGSGMPWWEVTVRTAMFWSGKRRRRVYTLQAFSDSHAARQGLQRFAEDVDGRPQIIVEP